MKKNRHNPAVNITNKEVQEYALEMTTPESPDIKQLIASSDSELEFIDMLSGNLVGQLLKMLVSVSGAKRVLEVGTFTGYSAIMIAEALPKDGKVVTIEMNRLFQKLAEKHFNMFDKHGKIQLIKGNAHELLNTIEGPFDLVFLDADKISYSFYFETILPKLAKNGLMAVDNVLWDGTVLNPKDPKSEALDEFNKKVAEDDRVEQVLLPIRDGLTLIRKK